MLWFYPYRFEYPRSVTNPAARLREVLTEPKWAEMKHDIQLEKVKLEQRLPFWFQNSWNPIFDGKFVMTGKNPYLVGHFRIHWLVLVITIAILVFPLFEVVTLLQEPEIKPGLVAGWRTAEITSNLEFFGFGVLIVFIGWLFGLRNANRIVTAIRESTAST